MGKDLMERHDFVPNGELNQIVIHNKLQKTLDKVKTSKAMGTDKIPSEMLLMIIMCT